MMLIMMMIVKLSGNGKISELDIKASKQVESF